MEVSRLFVCWAQRLLGSSDAGSCRARMEEVQKLLWEKEQLKREVEVKRREAQNTILRLETEIHDIETNKDKIVRAGSAYRAFTTGLYSSHLPTKQHLALKCYPCDVIFYF